MKAFSAAIEIIGINPYVLLPEKVLQNIFNDAGKDRGPIPVNGTIDGHPFRQTLVKYAGCWRLYLNGNMRTACGKDVGDRAKIVLNYDALERITPMHPALAEALQKNKAAHQLFKQLPPYMQKEMMRYINNLKTRASIEKNVNKALGFLFGKEKFIGRYHP
ncbi:MAG: DUF1905 domain-containing protein [Rhizobacter sp.]|nr:DUF1905 domain-containing protein [Ferruginibacter sp.]